jgi:hypothetical protein
VWDPKIATTFDKYATRKIGPVPTLAKTVPRSLLVNARHALRRNGDAERGLGDSDRDAVRA